MALRTYVKVCAEVSEDGKVTPLRLTFKGRDYEIDRVYEVGQAHAVNAGGNGMRYTIRIGAHKTFLFNDETRRWFVEEKLPGEIPRVAGMITPDYSYTYHF